MIGARDPARNVGSMRTQSEPDSVTAVSTTSAQTSRTPRTLTEDLRWRTDAQLIELLRIRPDLLDPIPGNLSRLAAHACSTASVLAVLDCLDRPTLQVLGRLATKSGAVSLAELAVECGASSWRDVAPVVSTLRSHALVWGSEPDNASARVQAVVAVREVVRGSDVPGLIDLELRMPKASAVASTTIAVAVSDPASAGVDRALVTINAIRWICEAWSNDAPTVLKSGAVGQRELNLVCDRVGCAPDEATFWISLAECADLVKLNGPPTGFVVPERVSRWLEMDHASQWAELVSAWIRGATPAGAARVRQLIFGWWARYGPGSTVTIDEFGAALADADPRGDRAVLHRRAGEALAQAGWLGLTSGGRLTPVGVVLAQAGSVSAPDLTAALRQAIAPEMPVPTSEFVIQADFTVVVAGLPHPTVRAGLTRLGTVESAGSATVIRLTERKITRAVADGWSGSQIEAFLARHSRTPIPQPVAYIIADAAARVSKSIAPGDDGESGAATDRVSWGRVLSPPDRATSLGDLEDVAPLAVILWAIRQADDAVQNGDGPRLADCGGEASAANSQNRAKPRPSTTAKVVGTIREAMNSGIPLLVGHVDPVGVESSSVVLALRLGGGSVQVLEQGSLQMRSLVLSRIGGVVKLTPSDWPRLPRFASSDSR